MSVLASRCATRRAPDRRRRDRRATACRRRRSSGAAASRSSSAHAVEPLPDGALVPSLTAPNVRDRAAVVGGARRACSSASAGRGASALVVPDPVAKVSLVRFEQVPAARAGSRSAHPLAGAEGGAVPDRGGAGQLRAAGVRAADGQEFVVVAGAARRRRASTRRSARRPARTRASSTSSTFNVINAVLARSRPAPPADWLLVNVAPDYASIAILRGADLIFFRNRGADGEGTLADLVHQTAMYYEDRLQGAGFAPRAAVRRRGAAAQAATSTDRAAASRSGSATRGRDRRPAAARRRWPIASRAAPALLDALAPLVGLLLREHGRRRRDPHEPLDAAVLQRARRPLVAAVAGAGRRRGARCSTCRACCSYSRSDTELATQASRDEARAAEPASSRPRSCARASTRADRRGVRSTRGRPTT